jgi:hypothetical protein
MSPRTFWAIAFSISSSSLWLNDLSYLFDHAFEPISFLLFFNLDVVQNVRNRWKIVLHFLNNLITTLWELKNSRLVVIAMIDNKMTCVSLKCSMWVKLSAFLFDQTCSRTCIILNTHNNVRTFPYKYIGLSYIPLTKMQGSRIHHKLKQQHLETVTSFVLASSNFFLEGVVTEIWSEGFFVIFSMNVHSYFLLLCATIDIVVKREIE